MICLLIRLRHRFLLLNSCRSCDFWSGFSSQFSHFNSNPGLIKSFLSICVLIVLSYRNVFLLLIGIELTTESFCKIRVNQLLLVVGSSSKLRSSFDYLWKKRQRTYEILNFIYKGANILYLLCQWIWIIVLYMAFMLPYRYACNKHVYFVFRHTAIIYEPIQHSTPRTVVLHDIRTSIAASRQSY